MSTENANKRSYPPISRSQIKKIQELAQSICYGSIHLVFQDGNLIQIERCEKIRFLDNET